MFHKASENLMKPTLILDLEIYRDYFLAMFRNVATGNVRAFEFYPGQALDINMIKNILRSYRIITFNGSNFDIPLLMLALKGADNATIKKACDAIINNNLRGWQFERQFDVTIPKSLDHIDLIEVAPGTASLKIYGGRLHAKRMQDLPIEPDESIAPEQRPILVEYCANDLATTQNLYDKLLPQLELRAQMSAEYGLDLRSKSDAQIAEAVIGHQVSVVLGEQVERPEVAAGTKFNYRPPAFIQFTTPDLQYVCTRQFRIRVPTTRWCSVTPAI